MELTFPRPTPLFSAESYTFIGHPTRFDFFDDWTCCKSNEPFYGMERDKWQVRDGVVVTMIPRTHFTPREVEYCWQHSEDVQRAYKRYLNLLITE